MADPNVGDTLDDDVQIGSNCRRSGDPIADQAYVPYQLLAVTARGGSYLVNKSFSSKIANDFDG